MLVLWKKKKNAAFDNSSAEHGATRREPMKHLAPCVHSVARVVHKQKDYIIISIYFSTLISIFLVQSC